MTVFIPLWSQVLVIGVLNKDNLVEIFQMCCGGCDHYTCLDKGGMNTLGEEH